MAYNTKYKLEWKDFEGLDWRILIQQDGFSGSITSIKPQSPAAKLKYEGGGKDKYNRVIASYLEINAVVTAVDDPFPYREFVTTSEKEYRVVLQKKPNSTWIDVWYGFLLPDIYRETYTDSPYAFKLRAIDGLGRLKNINYPTFNATSSYSLGSGTNGIVQIKAIKDLLDESGITLDITEFINLYEDANNTAEPLLGQIFVNPETYRNSEGNPISCKKVLEGILKPYGCRIRQNLSARWVIERVNEVHHDKSSSNYYEYTNYAKNSAALAQWTQKTFDPSTDITEITSSREERDKGNDPLDFFIWAIDAKEPEVEWLSPLKKAKATYRVTKHSSFNRVEGALKNADFASFTLPVSSGKDTDIINLLNWGEPTGNAPTTFYRWKYGDRIFALLEGQNGNNYIYHSSNAHTPSESEGTTFYMNGQAIYFYGKCKPESRATNVNHYDYVPQPKFAIKATYGGDTYWAQPDGSGGINFQNTTMQTLFFDTPYLNESHERKHEITALSVSDSVEISILLFEPEEVEYMDNNGNKKSADTSMSWEFAQIQNSDEGYSVRISNEEISTDSTKGEREVELIHGDSNLRSTKSGLMVENAGTPESTSHWRVKGSGNTYIAVQKLLIRQILKNYKEPSLYLTAGFYWGNTSFDPFYLKLTEIFVATTKSYTLLPSKLTINLENRQITGEFFQNLNETETPTYLVPDEYEEVPSTIPEGGIPGIIYSPIVGQGSQSLAQVTIVSTNNHTIKEGEFTIVYNACDIAESSIFTELPPISNLTREITIKLECDGCTDQDLTISVNSGDTDVVIGQGTDTRKTIACGEKITIAPDANNNKWVII